MLGEIQFYPDIGLTIEYLSKYRIGRLRFPYTCLFTCLIPVLVARYQYTGTSIESQPPVYRVEMFAALYISKLPTLHG